MQFVETMYFEKDTNIQSYFTIVVQSFHYGSDFGDYLYSPYPQFLALRMTMIDSSLSISREVSSLRHQVTDSLRSAILSGRFDPGSRLVERELCELLSVSRTLLREALQHLQAEGLIKVVPHKGLTIATIDANEAREIYLVRQSLEGMAGEGFARMATDAQILQLRQALEYLATPEASSTQEQLLAAKNRFYTILMEGCGNRVVGQMLTLLNNRITLLRRLSLSKPGRLPQTLLELDGIVCAIETRDPVRAGALCAAHVMKAAELVAQSFSPSAAEPLHIQANGLSLNSQIAQ